MFGARAGSGWVDGYLDGLHHEEEGHEGIADANAEQASFAEVARGLA